MQPISSASANDHQYLIEMGFSAEQVAIALQKHNNHIPSAVEYLIASKSAAPVSESRALIVIDPPPGSNKGPATTTTGESSDAQLQKAIEQSRKENEDSEMQKAIEMSLRNNALGPQPMDIDYSGIPKLSEDERLINQAIEQSLQMNTGIDGSKSADNPVAIKRVVGVYVLLQYVTILLQSKVAFKTAAPPVQNGIHPDVDTVEFMKELQRLFAYLVLTNQKYVDPSQLLKKLKDRTGNPIKTGNQEDVSEFNDIFLEATERGLKLDGKLAEPGSPNTIRKLFYGNSIQFISGSEEDGTPFEVKNTSVYNHLILRVGPELPDLYASLDSYVCDTVDYTTEKGFKTKAMGTLWFQQLPPVLMFQQSRVDFDAENRTYKKSLSPLAFEKEIFMDRYLEENRSQTSIIRGSVSELKGQLLKLESELNSLTRYKGRDHSIDSAIESVMDYLKDKELAGSSNPLQLDSTLHLLDKYLMSEKVRIEELKQQIATLRYHISAAFNHMRARSYTLYAVWVHQGVAGSGHYWAFLRDLRTEQWIRLNDMRTSLVSEEDVIKESVGGYANSSAYFLIYLDKNTADWAVQVGPSMLNVSQEEALSFIPDQLKQEISETNTKFLEAVHKYEKTDADSKVQKFVDKYKEKLAEVKKLATEFTPEKDYRIKSLWTFMYCQQMIEVLNADALQDMYVMEFCKGLTHDVDSEIYKKVCEKLGKEVVEYAKMLAGDPSTIEAVRLEHRKFQDVVQYCVNALTAIRAGRLSECGLALQMALRRDRDLASQEVRREEHIVFLIRLCVQTMLAELPRKMAQQQNVEAVVLLKDCLGFALSLGTTDIIIPTLKQAFERFCNQFPTFKQTLVAMLKFLESCPLNTRPTLSKVEMPSPPKLSPEEGIALMEKFEELMKQVQQEFSLVNIKPVGTGRSISIADLD